MHWYLEKDSNLRLPEYESVVLPLNYRGIKSGLTVTAKDIALPLPAPSMTLAALQLFIYLIILSILKDNLL